MALVRVCRVTDVPELGARRFALDERTIAIVHLGDDGYRAIDAVCSHEHAWLDEGDVDPEERTIECPKHGSTFDVDTGTPRSLPAIKPVQVYPVTVNDDDIMIEV
jgi:3-phenylpropionate/trans-cinnamate dioxygenase ferredoxin subunit